MKKVIVSIIIGICLLTSIGGTVIIEWLYEAFGNLSMDEIIFHIKVPMQGVNADAVLDCIRECAGKIIISTAILSFLLIFPIFKNIKIVHTIPTAEKKKTMFISVSIAILILILSSIRLLITTDIGMYVKNQLYNSKFIAEEYIDPEETKVEFPEQKRNLIYIFLESMETTFYSKKDGGLSEKDLIPEISKLAKENLNFSNTDTIGGAHTLYGTTWTAGAMTAQTTGVPLKISIEHNSMGAYSSFLGGAYSFGEILEENGYHNFLLLGSSATFGGRRNLFTQHGNYEIWDYISAENERKVSEKIWWGYTDDKLFEYAKRKILKLASGDKPFNFTTLTADTHFEDGYKCNDCPNIWDEQYKNVISCSSSRVGEFVEWIKKQDFYENTTIVISGDHLTMQPDFFPLEEGQEYEKKVVNVIINPAIEAENTKRNYSTFDLYPTTLAALGVKIEGDKLGLGTNLFSEEQTLIEKYGLEYVNNELMKTSKFYNNNILVEN